MPQLPVLLSSGSASAALPARQDEALKHARLSPGSALLARQDEAVLRLEIDELTERLRAAQSGSQHSADSQVSAERELICELEEQMSVLVESSEAAIVELMQLRPKFAEMETKLARSRDQQVEVEQEE